MPQKQGNRKENYTAGERGKNEGFRNIMRSHMQQDPRTEAESRATGLR